MKILIVEDEPSLRELMQRTLEKERYVVEVAATYGQALQKIEDYSYDCILLDIMLPDGSGLELLERLKALHKRENVIIISAKDSLEDKVLGLELGADDYLPKPFHLAELNARIKSVIRRNQHDGEITIRQGNVRIEPDKYRVFVDEQELELNRKEYDILLYFFLIIVGFGTNLLETRSFKVYSLYRNPQFVGKYIAPVVEFPGRSRKHIFRFEHSFYSICR